MKKICYFIYYYVVVNTLIFLINPLKCQANENYLIATWYKDKTCAVTYTFDDNTSKQLSVALPLFDKYNFKVTFYPVPNWSPNWSKLKAAVANGHEVGNHTTSHPYLNQLDSIKEEQEYKNAIHAIHTNIANGICQTIAYPYCVTGRKNILSKYFIGGRICSGMIETATPNDFFNISSILVGSESSLKTAENLNNKVKETKNKKGWCVFLLHGIDNDGGYSSLSSNVLESHLEFINTNNNDYWVTTFVNAIKYIKERNSAKIQEQEINADSIRVVVSDTLNDSIYNIPITVMRLLPEHWPYAKCYKNGELTKVQIKSIDNLKFIMIDVIPDIDEIYLVKSLTIDIEEDTVVNNIRFQNNEVFRINKNDKILEIHSRCTFHYYILDIQGKVYLKGKEKYYASIPLHKFSGIYFLKAVSNYGIYNQPLIIQ